MDPNTGHLIELLPNESLPQGYEPIPPELEHAARLKLANRRDAYVSLTSGGKLSQFAKDKRRMQQKTKASNRRRRKHARRIRRKT